MEKVKHRRDLAFSRTIVNGLKSIRQNVSLGKSKRTLRSRLSHSNTAEKGQIEKVIRSDGEE